MTLLGKILVLVNFGLSVCALAWVVSLYANRTDWTNKTYPAAQPGHAPPRPGELAARQEAVKAAWALAPPAQAAYRENLADVQGQEAWRPAERKFYADELAHVRDGATDQKPVRALLPDDAKDAAYKVKTEVKAGDPPYQKLPKVVPAQDRRGKALKSLAGYHTDYGDLTAKIGQEYDRYKAGVVKDTDLTNELVGTPDVKGLYDRITAEQIKLDLVQKEYDVVRPLLINTVVEAELLQKRRAELARRRAELQKAAGTDR